MKILLSIAILLLMISCSGNRSSDGILSQEKMEDVLWDVIEASSFTEQFIKRDSLKDAALEDMKFQQQIFQQHKVTKEEFYKSYKYYTVRPDLMSTILDTIIARSQRDRMSVLERGAGGGKIKSGEK